MSLNESIVEDAALEWFGERCRVALSLTPALAQGKREEDDEVVLVGRMCDSLRRLNLAIPSRTLATLRDPAGAGLPKLLSGELSVAGLEAKLESMS